MRESVKTQGNGRPKKFSQVAFPQSEACTHHMTGMRRVMTAGFRDCLVGKAFL